MSSKINVEEDLVSIRDLEGEGENDIKDLQKNILNLGKGDMLDYKKASVSTYNVGDEILSPNGHIKSAKKRNVREDLRSTNRSYASNYSGYN